MQARNRTKNLFKGHIPRINAFSVRFSKSAFTLIEVLLVVSLLAVISIAVFNTFLNGMKIWNKSYRAIFEEDILVFFEKINMDLRNVVRYSQIRFEGDKNHLTFATLVKVPSDPRRVFKEESYVNEIGRVEYYFDETDRAIVRRQAGYGQTFKNKFEPPRRLANTVNFLRFMYFYKTAEGYTMQKEGENIIPAAVGIEVEYGYEKDRRRMTKFIEIPIGG